MNNAEILKELPQELLLMYLTIRQQILIRVKYKEDV